MTVLPGFELLAPVGSLESLMAAVKAGADAVYFGIGHLNMRSKSTVNFTIADLENITRICNENQIRTYLTLNTVVFDEELEEMRKVVDAAKTFGINAVIASDMAVMEYARANGVEVHLSTQCNVTNIEAIKFYATFADVIVTARELSLMQVQEINRTIEKENICGPSGNKLRIEAFVHGALCMAVSGKCYLSLDNMNHSANRGACLQLCRRAYLVKDRDEGFELEIDNEYIMSPKDLCTIGFLDKIIKAGISVFKIEGRGRSPEYVYTVTKCYKEAIEAIRSGTFSAEKVKGWMQQLSSVYNRGFWDGYYLGRKTGEWTEKYGSRATKIKKYIGKVTNYFSRSMVAEIKIETGDLKVGDDLLITGTTTGVSEFKISEIRVNLISISAAEKGDICSIPVPELLRKNDKVYLITENDENIDSNF